MALELENINNLIADDLDLRNRNWGEIDTALTGKADLSEIEVARGTEATLGERLDSIDVHLHNPIIPIMDYDPINPAEGQIWFLRPAIARDDFRGEDGDLLNDKLWDVTFNKTTGSTITHAPTNKVDIRNGKAQFNYAVTETVGDGGRVEVLARLKTLIKWENEKRTIKWKQQPFKWAGTWGVVLTDIIAVNGGGVIGTDYAIRVVHSNTNTSLQVIKKGVGLTFNQNYVHGAGQNDLLDYKLELDKDNITLFQGGVQKLSSPASNVGITSAWFYLMADTTITTPTIRDVDDLFIE
jgi:hypothetical protein